MHAVRYAVEECVREKIFRRNKTNPSEPDNRHRSTSDFRDAAWKLSGIHYMKKLI